MNEPNPPVTRHANPKAGDPGSSSRLRSAAVGMSVITVVILLATITRLLLWHMDLMYLEPWYEEVPYRYAGPYRTFINKQLLLTGIPMLLTNSLTLALLWAALRSKKE